MESNDDTQPPPGVARTHGSHDFTTAATDDVYVGNILALRVDHVTMPGGRSARREVVEHPGAVAIVAIDDAERIVLIHQYRYPLGRRLWELPAGLLDVPGEDPLRAARRELAEEVGLTAQDWSVAVDVASSPGFTDESVRVFLARSLRDVQRPAAEDNEEADLVIRRFPLHEAVRMVFAGEMVNGPAVAGVLAARLAQGEQATPRASDAVWPDQPHRFRQRGAGLTGAP